MKTIIYLPTLLALIIQVTVSGQTPGNQVRKIRMNIMGIERPVEKATVCTSTKSTNTEIEALLKQARDLKTNAQKLREEAISIEKQSLLKQIEASELSAKITYEKFDQNKTLITQLLSDISENTNTAAKAQNFNKDALQFLKIAKEMREEANAQFTEEARYGDMSNAEEQELLALKTQQQAIDLLQQYNPSTEQLTEAIAYYQVPANLSLPMDAVNINPNNTRLADVLKQAAELKITAHQLREVALDKQGNEKNMMIAEAVNLEQEYLAKQIEASELSAKTTYEKFYRNRILIAVLINNIKGNEELSTKAKNLNEEAERFLRIGKEMREEANAQFTKATRYGDMSNAEEEEVMALGKQQETFDVLNQASPKLTFR